MTTELWWIYGISVVVAFLFGMGVGAWGSYQFTRRRGHDSTSYIPQLDQQPVRLPPLPPEPLLDEPGHNLSAGRLVWGQEGLSSQDPPVVRWGPEVVEPPVNRPTRPRPEVVQCPLCRTPVNEATDSIFKCPYCETIYHLDHWRENGPLCPICKQEVT